MQKQEYRIEHDSMGELNVPINALYGAQTQRAIDNFTVSGDTMPEAFIQALLSVKAAAATANGRLQCLDPVVGSTIADVCSLLKKDPQMMVNFPVDIFQTGSGTSTNMNANEVIARLATQKIGQPINPNDHVNFGQSSNDVIPTTIHVSAAIAVSEQLLPALIYLVEVIETKAEQVKGYCKTGRTHLMDAMPVRFDQTLLGWAAQIQQNIEQLRALQPSLQMLAQGGTAVGTGINAHESFANEFCLSLSELTGLEFAPASNHFALIGSQDTIVALSGQLKATAVSIMKISNDLRWMNSGPLAGLGEISLEALQPGSSIMPGKVNPVIPESAAMAAAQVIGNDAAITVGGQSGSFELNVMLPMIAANILNSLKLLTNVTHLLADKAILTFTVNEERLNDALYKNPILVTALNPIIGYAAAAAIAKQAYKENRPIIDVALENTDLERAALEELLNPLKLTAGGFSTQASSEVPHG